MGASSPAAATASGDAATEPGAGATAARWTRLAEVTSRIATGIDSGAWLRDDDTGRFPLRLPLRGPGPRDLLDRPAAAREWSQTWRRVADGPGLTLEETRVGGRVIGASQVPCALTVASLDDAARLVKRTPVVAAFRAALALTADHRPDLLAWLGAHPVPAVRLVSETARGRSAPSPEDSALADLCAVVDWFEANPRSGLYLRQVDIPGVDTKFLEEHRGMVAQALDAVLPGAVVDPDAVGVRGFARRYGLRDAEDILIRVRVLDAALESWPGAADLALAPTALAALPRRPDRVVVTENKVNLLALPPLPGTLALFGAGYGFAALREIAWLRETTVLYWGDIDTHGFAILDQLRADGIRARSVLMDIETLLAHRKQWVREVTPTTAPLTHLHDDEAQLYRDLVDNRHGDQVRLEQERIPFRWAARRLREVVDTR